MWIYYIDDKRDFADINMIMDLKLGRLWASFITWTLKNTELSLAGDQRDVAEVRKIQSMIETQSTIAGERHMESMRRNNDSL